MSSQPIKYDLVTKPGILEFEKLLALEDGVQIVCDILSHLPSEPYYFTGSLECYETTKPKG
ncbi:hypothetical protein QFZ77_004585 [Paenibacillus sp. V4I3]|nr:hypothetical protein [Paenibacillus sp. V4I3]